MARKRWRFRWIPLNGDVYHEIGLDGAGRLINPYGYPNTVELRAALEHVIARHEARERKRRKWRRQRRRMEMGS